MVLSGEATATPKRRDGIVESIRDLRIARRSAIKALANGAHASRACGTQTTISLSPVWTRRCR